MTTDSNSNSDNADSYKFRADITSPNTPVSPAPAKSAKKKDGNVQRDGVDDMPQQQQQQQPQRVTKQQYNAPPAKEILVDQISDRLDQINSGKNGGGGVYDKARTAQEKAFIPKFCPNCGFSLHQH